MIVSHLYSTNLNILTHYVKLKVEKIEKKMGFKF